MPFIDRPSNGPRRLGRSPNARVPGLAPVMAAPQEIGPQDGSDPGETSTERLVRTTRRVDKFHIDPKLIPDGWSYEWKRVSVYGQPDPDHMLNLKANHWRPVPLSRHQHLMPGLTEGYDDKGPYSGCIMKDGQLLMERPAYLTMDAQQEDYDIAIDQVRRKEREVGQAPVGTFARSGNPSLDRTTGIRKTYRPLTAEE